MLSFAAIIYIMGMGLFAQSVATLDDLLKPDALFADQNRLYIGEGAEVTIYSLKDYSKIGSFGKEGEGPKEFKTKQFIPLSLFMDAQGERLIISSLNKISFYTKSGDFIEEKRVKSNFFTPNFQLLGEGMVRADYAIRDKVNYSTLMLYDKDLNEIKEIFSIKSPFQRGGKMNPLRRPMQYSADAAAKHLAVTSGNGEVFIFDEKGNKTLTITPKAEPIPLTENHKNKIYEFYQTDPRFKRFWNFMKDRIEMPAKLPLIHLLKADGGLIYVITYFRKENSVRFLVYDKTGKLKMDKYVSFYLKNFTEPYPYAIGNSKLYQIVENDDEEWELHVTSLN